MAEMVKLLCPLCVAEGKVEPVETSTDFAWLPALLARWVPEYKRNEGFISLEEAIAKAPQFEALVENRGKRREAKVLCSVHGRVLRDAKIWTTKYTMVLEIRARAAAKRAAEEAERSKNAFGSIASILGGEKVAEITAAVEPKPVRKPRAAAKPKGDSEETGRKPRASSKGRQRDALRQEIEDALNEA